MMIKLAKKLRKIKTVGEPQTLIFRAF